ncbi:MAG: diaminopimelate epimerase, partial [Rhodospirillales bacterium]|nr:diaminopimelate epimerase [Rhodospirillales bacterium]
MRFTKMHGIGNDYVYINGYEQSPPSDPAALAELAKRISDRHFGVGSDGLILVIPPEVGVDAHVRMRMFNADGSEAEMCGNGIRCVAKYVYDHGWAKKDTLVIETGNGNLTIDVEVEDGLVSR